MDQEQIVEFYQELQDRLNALAEQENAPEQGRWRSKRWNREIKGVLVQLGQQRDYQTCAHTLPDGIEATWGEWLYDVAWLTTAPGFYLQEVGLVVEIEWRNQGDAWDDYQKLHVAKADVRLMVHRHPGLIDECLQQLDNMGRQVSSEECYIFAIYQPGERCFTFHIRGM